MASHIIAGAIRAGTMELKCPHCGEVQTRARRKGEESVACRKCRRAFKTAEGERAARESSR